MNKTWRSEIVKRQTLDAGAGLYVVIEDNYTYKYTQWYAYRKLEGGSTVTVQDRSEMYANFDNAKRDVARWLRVKDYEL